MANSPGEAVTDVVFDGRIDSFEAYKDRHEILESKIGVLVLYLIYHSPGIEQKKIVLDTESEQTEIQECLERLQKCNLIRKTERKERPPVYEATCLGEDHIRPVLQSPD